MMQMSFFTSEFLKNTTLKQNGRNIWKKEVAILARYRLALAIYFSVCLNYNYKL